MKNSLKLYSVATILAIFSVSICLSSCRYRTTHRSMGHVTHHKVCDQSATYTGW